MNEFEAINLIVNRLGSVATGEGVTIGPGDDGAVVRFEPEEETVVTSDVLVEQQHFPAGSPAGLVGYRSVAANISDLSGMGARPRYLTIALTTESIDKSWLLAFADGVRACCEETGTIVVGGNLAKGPKSIAITALGSVLSGRSIARSGADVGDDIWLTGAVGASVVALKRLRLPIDGTLEEFMKIRDVDAIARYFLPIPRVDFASLLIEFASSATDVSDGLACELSQLSSASSKKMRVDLDLVPVWDCADWREAVQSDDSYEILFTAPVSKRAEIHSAAAQTKTPVAQIGYVQEGNEVELLTKQGAIEVGVGFSHF
ncbi:MAG: thiamine-phosphate kinase [Gammaproteobacteria bacterium]|nr:thiamine-phosphate kinase [Gammaproteobacteria bacterium]